MPAPNGGINIPVDQEDEGELQEIVIPAQAAAPAHRGLRARGRPRGGRRGQRGAVQPAAQVQNDVPAGARARARGRGHRGQRRARGGRGRGGGAPIEHHEDVPAEPDDVIVIDLENEVFIDGPPLWDLAPEAPVIGGPVPIMRGGDRFEAAELPPQPLPAELEAEDNDTTRCVACTVHRANYAAYNCGHLVFCDVCVRSHTNNVCPNCRNRITSYMFIFYN